ncbi:MAG: CBS domain-containing protein [Candidatus Heimdallarchaeota archaeon]|nr:CBS domain-containing protein [Candidatus Heimdallarchaeota archaeon]MBY8993607.1 CBS domain-containing protein [Candidatus Heimdallarchaeota archaeon]
MKVADVMTIDPVCVKVPGTIDDLYEIIRKTDLTSFPVIKDDTGELVGIVTETDIVSKPSETQLALLMTKNPQTAAKKDLISDVISILTENSYRQLPVVSAGKLVGVITIGDIISKVIAITSSEKTIEEYMSDNILGVWQDTPLPVCQKIMEFSGTEAAIVFDDANQMVGIVTLVDFVKFFESISSEKRSDMTAGEGKEGSWDAVSTIIVHTKDLTLPNIPVKDIMTKEVVTTFSKATLSEVAKKMTRMELYQLPVVDAKGNLVGIIRDFDLLKAYAGKTD